MRVWGTLAIAAVLVALLWLVFGRSESEVRPTRPSAEVRETGRPEEPGPAPPEMPTGPVVLRGRVLHEDRSPFAGLVRVGSVEASTDEAGRFEIRGLDPGEVPVEVEDPGRIRVAVGRVVVPRADEYEIVLGGEHEVSGRVVSIGDGAPIAGVEMRLEEGYRTIAVATAEDGRFRIRHAMVRPKLVVRAAGYEPRTLWWQSLRPDMVIRLRRSARCVGIVVAAADGRPVAGVPVYADDARTVSDAEGRFVLDDVPSGERTVYAFGAGWISRELTGTKFTDDYNPLAVDVPVGGTGERTLVVVPAGRVEGRVLDAEGKPVAGAAVRPANEVDLYRFVAAVGTDGDGRFVFDTMPPGTVTLTATADGYPPAVSGEVRVVTGETAEVEIRLAAPRWITAVLVDDVTGDPIAGATVFAARRKWISGFDGRVRIGPLSPETVTLSVHAPGYVGPPLTYGRFEAALGNDDLGEIRLIPVGWISGRVTGPPEAPVGKATIYARTAESAKWPYYSVPRFEAEADGTFRAPVPPEGKYAISAAVGAVPRRFEGSGIFASGARDVVIEVKEVADPIAQHRAQPWNTWRLSVLGPDAEPVESAGATYYVEEDRGRMSGPATVDGNTIEIRVPEDTKKAWVEVFDARGAGGERLGARIFGPLGAEGGEAEVRLEPGLGIRGRVVDSGGAGRRGVRVSANPIPPEGFVEGMAPYRSASTRSGEDGAFLLDGLGAGLYDVSAGAPPGTVPAAPLRVAAGATDVVIRLGTASTATVTVVDYEGRPLPDAGVLIEGDEWRVHESTDGKGQVHITGFDPAAEYRISINDQSGREDLMRIDTRPWTPKDETFVLDRAYSIEGVVADPEGKPLEHVVVTALTPDGEETGTWSGRDGRFVLAELPAGDARLWVSLFGLDAEHRAGAPPTVVAAGTRDVRLTLDPGYVLEVVVEGWNQSLGYPKARLTELTDRGARREETMPWSGRLLFYGLEPGSEFAFWVGPTVDGRSAYYRGRLPENGRLTVPLKKGGEITGRLRLPANATRNPPTAYLRGDGVSLDGLILPDHRFRIAGVPEGTFTVTGAVVDDDGRVRRAETKAKAGDKLELTLP